MTITLAVEGKIDETVAKRLLLETALAPGPVYGLRGKDYLDAKLTGYNSAARFAPWLVLRDLDQDADCAPILRAQLLPEPAPQIRLHIVIRAVEAWLLSDHEAMGRFLGVRPNTLPIQPEELLRPKAALLSAARRSTRRAILEGIPPAVGAAAQVGPGYTAMLTDFVLNAWRPQAAAERSESLRRLLRHLRRVREIV